MGATVGARGKRATGIPSPPVEWFVNLGLGDIIDRMEQAVGRVLTDWLLYLVYGAACVGVLTFAAEHVTTLIESPSIGRRALGWLSSSIVAAILFFGFSQITFRRARALVDSAREVQTVANEAQTAAMEAIETALAEQAKCRELHAVCLEWGDKVEAARKVVERHQP